MLLVLAFLRLFIYKRLSSAYYGEVLQALGVAGVKAVTVKKAALVHAKVERSAGDRRAPLLSFISETLCVFGR